MNHLSSLFSLLLSRFFPYLFSLLYHYMKSSFLSHCFFVIICYYLLSNISLDHLLNRSDVFVYCSNHFIVIHMFVVLSLANAIFVPNMISHFPENRQCKALSTLVSIFWRGKILIFQLPSHDKRYSKGNSLKPHCDDVRRAATR